MPEHVLKPDQYFGMLDSLARFYNSQVTAHVGYTLSFSALLGAAILTLLSSVVLDLSYAICWRVLTAVLRK